MSAPDDYGMPGPLRSSSLINDRIYVDLHPSSPRIVLWDGEDYLCIDERDVDLRDLDQLTPMQRAVWAARLEVMWSALKSGRDEL